MPELKPQITTGNILQIVVMIGAVAVLWGGITAQMNFAAERISDHETRLRALEVRVLDSLARVEQRLIIIERTVRE